MCPKFGSLIILLPRGVRFFPEVANLPAQFPSIMKLERSLLLYFILDTRSAPGLTWNLLSIYIIVPSVDAAEMVESHLDTICGLGPSASMHPTLKLLRQSLLRHPKDIREPLLQLLLSPRLLLRFVLADADVVA